MALRILGGEYERSRPRSPQAPTSPALAPGRPPLQAPLPPTDITIVDIPATPFAAILDTADHELTLLRTQRNALDQQKRGLMQRLLTGKVRVKPN